MAKLKSHSTQNSKTIENYILSLQSHDDNEPLIKYVVNHMKNYHLKKQDQDNR